MNTSQTPDYGEPWKLTPIDQHDALFLQLALIRTRYGVEVCDHYRKGTIRECDTRAERIIACVNVMAGRPDPAAAMARLAQLEWVPVKERRPEFDDANDFQDVEWSDGKDIWQGNYLQIPSLHNATHWRRITLP